MWSGAPSWLTTALADGTPLTVTHWAELWQGGSKKATLDVVDGSVTQDASAATRWTCDVTLDADGLVPEDAIVGTDRKYGDNNYGSGIYGDYRRRVYRGLLLPLKTQLRLFSTYKSGANTVAVPMGRYTVGDPTFSDDDGPFLVRVSGWSVEADIAGAILTAPYRIGRGTNRRTAIINLVGNRVAGTSVTCPTTASTVTQLVLLPGTSVNPWRVIQDLAAGGGWVVGADRTGAVVVAEPDDPGAPGAVAVWDLHDDGSAIRLEQTPSGRDVVNTVVVVASKSGEVPVYATAQDTSSSYSVTALGRVVGKEFSLDSINDQADADNAAVALLRRWSGFTESLELDVWDGALLDVGDLVSVTSEMLELEDDLYRVDRISVPLDVESPHTVTVSRRLA